MNAADVVVVGAGVAGLSAARAAARRGARVLVLAKGGVTATSLAQGGIAVAQLDGGVAGERPDSVALHVADTVAAGGGLVDAAAATEILGRGPAALADLIGLGARFDGDGRGGLALTREGGHSVRRIVHAGGDATGAEVQRTLDTAGIAVLPAIVDDVLVGPGGVAGVVLRSGEVIEAPAVVLATGGLGRMFPVTSNPAGATADGIALALRAGAAVADLEFIQFHPTVLYAAGAVGVRPLVSEAVRGEGAVLVDVDGRRVTAGSAGDLAPRDVVARAVAQRLAETGAEHVFLDATSIPDFAARFPTIAASCAAVGVDPARDPIPVAPAAHYSCGGIVVDGRGRSAVPGLFAAGEVARTGLHGANRLASNSLTEGLVAGARAGESAAGRRHLRVSGGAAGAGRPAVAGDVVRRAMGAGAGVLRCADGLAAARDAIEQASPGESEDASLTLAALAVLAAAEARIETRGCHTRVDGIAASGPGRSLITTLRDGVVTTRWADGEWLDASAGSARESVPA